jgi:hypothetical protein
MAINMSATLVASLFGQQGQSSLLSALGNAPRAASAGEAVVALRRVTKAGEEAKGLAKEKKDPVTLTAVAQFRQALESSRTLDKALSDPRVLKVLLPALGLPDQIGNPGLVKRALLSDPKDPKGVASQLGTTWVNAAATLNLKATTTPKTVAVTGLTDTQTASVAAQLRFGENILTAPATRSTAPKVRAFDGLPDSLTQVLARQLRPGENATTERAKLEVDYAAVMTAATMRSADYPQADLPDGVKNALQQMSNFMRTGALDSAAFVVDETIASLEGGGGLPADQLKLARVTLIETGITIDQLRRNADGVAKRVEDLVRLDMPAGVTWPPASELSYQTRLSAFQKEGVDKNVNFPLEVAAAMGRRMLAVATDDGGKAAAQSYIDGAQKILDERGGKPTAPIIEGLPMPRITDAEATKILDAMKNTAPPNIPRAQIEVNYGAGALRSALEMAGKPIFGLPSIAFQAMKDIAELAKSGTFDAALIKVDETLEAMANDTSLPKTMLREGSAALLEIGMSLELVTRDAKGYAERAEKRAALDAPQKAAWSRDFQMRLENLHNDGINGNVNLALEVAAAMAHRMDKQAANADESTTAQSLINRSEQVWSGRDGKPSVATSFDGSPRRITSWEATKIVDSMKTVNPLGSLSDAKTLDILINGFTKYEYLNGLSTANPGMSDAIYFMDNAKTVKTPYDILGNSAMRRVVLGALGLPDQIAIQPVETQARAITSRLKLTDMQDATKVRGIAERYLMARADQAAVEQANVSNDIFSAMAKISFKV